MYCTIDSLIERCGDNEVVVRLETSKDAYRLGKRVPMRRFNLAKYIEQMRAAEAGGQRGNAYLAANAIRYVCVWGGGGYNIAVL